MPSRTSGDCVEVDVTVRALALAVGARRVMHAPVAPTVSLADPSPVYVGVEATLTATVTGGVETVDFYAGAVLLAADVPVVAGVAETAWTPADETAVDLRADGYAGAVLLDSDTVAGVTPLIVISITAPAPGTQFIVGVAQAVSGTSLGAVGLTVQASFDGFATIVGTSGVIPAGGAWSLNVTALLGDYGETDIEVREVGGIAARATLACTVVAGANDVPGGVDGWWETYPYLEGIAQPWTRSDAVLQPNATLWTPSNTAFAAGVADPYGGAAAYSCTESVDAGVTLHNAYAINANGIASYQDLDVWLQSVARDWVRIRFGTSAAHDCWLNNTLGVAGTVRAGLTATLVESIGTWRHWHITFRLIPTSNNIYFGPCTVDATTGYVGDGSVACNIYGVVGRQERLSAIADLSRVGGTGAYRGANLVNATVATQLLFQDTFATVNGRPVAMREAGRAGWASSTHANVLAVASGDDPAFCLFGVTSFSGLGGGVTSWQGGAGFDLPLRSNDGINMYCRRSDGINPESIFAWPGVTIADFAAPVTCAVICNTDRTRELWIAGALRSTVTLANLAGWNPTVFYTGYSAGTSANNQLAALSVRAGQIPGATAADRYQVIRPALQAMAARWGGLPA